MPMHHDITVCAPSLLDSDSPTLKVRTLGCSGSIGNDSHTTSFLIDDDLLIDAGTGVCSLTLDEMSRINHVLLSHSHLDHIAALPFMIDAVAASRSAPLHVHAPQATIEALKTHIFNGTIWPDFSRIPTPATPFLCFHPLAPGQTLQLGGKHIEVLSAVHTVPAVGYAVSRGPGQSHWAYTGDTERNPALWKRLNQLEVAHLVIETAFSNASAALAQRSLHLCPQTLAAELACRAPGKHYPIYITHTKPAETARVMLEIHELPQATQPGSGTQPDIRWLQAGQRFEV